MGFTDFRQIPRPCRGDLSSEALAKLEAVRRRKRNEDGRCGVANQRRVTPEVAA